MLSPLWKQTSNPQFRSDWRFKNKGIRWYLLKRLRSLQSSGRPHLHFSYPPNPQTINLSLDHLIVTSVVSRILERIMVQWHNLATSYKHFYLYWTRYIQPHFLRHSTNNKHSVSSATSQRHVWRCPRVASTSTKKIKQMKGKQKFCHL